MSIQIIHADCRDAIKAMADCSIDSVVTDPPYALTSIVKRFGNGEPSHTKTAQDIEGRKTPIARLARGFMNQQWDNGSTAFDPAFWSEVLRVLKPGAHLIAFGGTRTYHRLACAIEDAGFEIRDQIGWLFGSGFPKSHSVAGAIDRANGIGPRAKAFNMKGRGDRAEELDENGREFLPPYEPVTDDARAWSGWGTALKPAWEPIVLARKPLAEKTIAANVLTHGTGALNIDGCRVDAPEGLTSGGAPTGSNNPCFMSKDIDPRLERSNGHALGRWPANVIHDGSAEVIAAFPESDAGQPTNERGTGGIWSGISNKPCGPQYGDIGSAARFFYSAKADSSDRLGSKHPTVKPVDLMAHLCRLITPPGGTVLDPFAGSGTTGMACLRESFNAVLIEREAAYVENIRYRLEHIKGEDLPLFKEQGQCEIQLKLFG